MVSIHCRLQPHLQYLLRHSVANVSSGTLKPRLGALFKGRLKHLVASTNLGLSLKGGFSNPGESVPTHSRAITKAAYAASQKGNSNRSSQPAVDDKSDLYKEQAAAYVQWRPQYPESYLRDLADLAPAPGLLWDVGTGSGQAAVGLAPHFDRVVATDVSPWQLAQAPHVPNVTYKATSADLGDEELSEVLGGLGTVDLVTVASALHFFDVENMTQTVLAALKPGGVYAPFTYNMPSYEAPRMDAAMEAILVAMAGPNYREEAAKRECNPLDGYRSMHFPFEPVEGRTDTEPRLSEMRFVWRFENIMGFLSSTSYTKRLAEHPDGGALLKELEHAWAEGGRNRKLCLSCGRERAGNRTESQPAKCRT